MTIVAAPPANPFQIIADYAQEPELFHCRDTVPHWENTVKKANCLFSLHKSQLPGLKNATESRNMSAQVLLQNEEVRRNRAAADAYMEGTQGNIRRLREAYASGDGNALLILHNTCRGCAERGHGEQLLEILDLTKARYGEQPNVTDPIVDQMRDTAQAVILEMAKKGSLPVVQAFFPFAVRFTLPQMFMERALDAAGESGSDPLINWLIGKAKKMGQNINIGCACTGAVRKGHFDLANKLLVSENIDVNTWLDNDFNSQSAIEQVIRDAAEIYDIDTLRAATMFTKYRGLSLNGKICPVVQSGVSVAVKKALNEDQEEMLHSLAQFCTICGVEIRGSLWPEQAERFSKYLEAQKPPQ